MLVRPHERIEVLCAAESQHLQFAFTDKFLQVTVYGCQADVWQLAADFEKNLIRGGMRSLILGGLPNHFQLSGISLLLFQRTKSLLEIREQRLAGLSFQLCLGLIVRMFDQQRRFLRARESRAFIGPKKAADIGITLDIRHPREVEIAAVRLRLAGEGILQIVVAFCAVQTLCRL